MVSLRKHKREDSMMELTGSQERLPSEMRDNDQTPEERSVMPCRGDVLHQPTSPRNLTGRDYWSFNVTEQPEKEYTATLKERAAGINELEG